MPKAQKSNQVQAKHKTSPYHPTRSSTIMAAPQTTPPPTGDRHTSSPWTSSDDTQLMNARQKGLHWAPIAAQFFPNKTPNACRKRHERLMEKRKQQDDWDVEALATAYTEVREQMWQILANKVGQRWQVVELKCMEKGFKTLQNASRTAARRGRTVSAQSLGEQEAFQDCGLLLLDDDANSEGRGEPPPPFLPDRDEPMPLHPVSREDVHPPYSTHGSSSARSYTPQRKFSTASTTSIYSPVSGTSPPLTLPTIRELEFETRIPSIGSMLQSPSVTTH